MDLKQLEYFVRVAELGSFTRAAAALNVAQPALSRQVRLLEVELRQTLLLRNGRGATPTEAGKLLLEHGHGILHQVERTREEMGRVRGSLAGRVAIGLPPSLARVLTVPLARAFRAQLPKAIWSISEALSATTQDLLLTGRLDIAVLYNAQTTPELEITPLHDEELMLVQARQTDQPDPLLEAAPVALTDVARMPLVIPSRPNAIRVHIESEMASAGCKPTIALEIDGVASILDLVADGAGVALLSRLAVASAAQPARLQMRAVDPPLRTRLSVATSALRPATLTQQKALELITDTVKGLNA